MPEEEKSVFESAEISEDLPTEETSPDEIEETPQEFNPTISTESPKDRQERLGEKKEMDGKVVTIKEIGFTRPRTQDTDGAPLEPKKTLDGKTSFYPGKLKIKFEEDNLVEYYPNFHYFVTDEGKVNMQAKINRKGENAVSKLFKLAIVKMGKPEDEISDQDFYDWLVGKKVKMSTAKGKYLGKAWFRNDVLEFVD